MATSADLELNCCEYRLTSPSVSHRLDGTFFKCKLGPLPADALAALENAAQSRAAVRLVFESTHIDFVGVAITRAEPGWVELVGRLASQRGD